MTQQHRLGARLQEYRIAHKVTQQEIAEACGLSKNYISAIERGVNKVNAETLIAYAQRLDVSLDELVGFEAGASILPELRMAVSQLDAEQQQKALDMIKILIR